MIILKTPKSPAGLRGRTAVDMRTRQWGELKAISQGHNGFWWFECPKGHRALRDGSHIRFNDKRGKPAKCKDCKGP